MKSILKYISLLIFSGLIIPFCYQFQAPAKKLTGKELISPKTEIANQNKMPVAWRVARNIAQNVCPALKSENNL